MVTISKWIIISFGMFILWAGILMIFKPNKANEILQKAGSSIFINYGEITFRMIVAIAFILYSDFSAQPDLFKVVGWFMLITSFILFLVPRKLHHNFSLKCADILKPVYFQIISPFSIIFGCLIIYWAM